jgi:hypothetical protein
MGDPCPMKNAGIKGVGGITFTSFNNCCALVSITDIVDKKSRLFILIPVKKIA